MLCSFNFTEGVMAHVPSLLCKTENISVFFILCVSLVLKLLKMAVGMRALLDTVMQALPQVHLHRILWILLPSFLTLREFHILTQNSRSVSFSVTYSSVLGHQIFPRTFHSTLKTLICVISPLQGSGEVRVVWGLFWTVVGGFASDGVGKLEQLLQCLGWGKKKKTQIFLLLAFFDTTSVCQSDTESCFGLISSWSLSKVFYN